MIISLFAAIIIYFISFTKLRNDNNYDNGKTTKSAEATIYTQMDFWILQLIWVRNEIKHRKLWAWKKIFWQAIADVSPFYKYKCSNSKIAEIDHPPCQFIKQILLIM